jgi:hypothetical protein
MGNLFMRFMGRSRLLDGEPTPPNPGTPTTKPEEPTELDNSTIKNSALFQSVTKDLVKAREELEAFKKAQEESANAAALKKAEEEKNYSEMSRLAQEKFDREKKELEDKLMSIEADKTKAELKAALASAGARVPKGFVDVAFAQYKATEDAEIGSFVESLKGSEDYKGFFESNFALRVNAPPKAGSPSPSDNTLTVAQALVDRNSADMETRKKARARLKEEYLRTGTWPE